MRHLVADGRRLEHRWIGPPGDEAPTLVFLHEGLGCAAMWRDVPEAIAARAGMGALVYSRAGYGGSDPVPLPRPLDYMEHEGERVLPEVLDAAGVREAILVGHSDGASIAIVHAGTDRARPRVRAVVLEAPHVFCEELSVRSIAATRDAYASTDLRARLAKWHGANVDVAFRGWNDAWLDPRFRAWSIARYVPRIEAPILALQGADDEYGTVAQLEAIARDARAPVETRVFADCGHAPHKDRREETIDAIAAFARGALARRPATR